MAKSVRRGEMWYYNFGTEFDGSVEGKVRPCVVISNNNGNKFGTTALVCPITTRGKEALKSWQVYFKYGNRDQIILCEQIRCVNIAKLNSYMGTLTKQQLAELDKALMIELDLPINSSNDISNKDSNATKDFSSSLKNDIIKSIHTEIVNANKTVLESQAKLYEKLLLDIINEFSNNNVSNEISNIKSLFNQSVINTDTMITQILQLYQTLLATQSIQSSEPLKITSTTNLVMNQSDNVQNIHNSVNKVKKTKTSKGRKTVYTIEFASQFIKDYYSLSKQELLNKYNCENYYALNTKKSAICAFLKRNGVDYKTLKINKDDNALKQISTHRKYKGYKAKTNYTIEYATQFIIDFYSDDREAVLKKYNVISNNALNDKKTGVVNFLKRNGIDYKTLKPIKEKEDVIIDKSSYKNIPHNSTIEDDKLSKLVDEILGDIDNNENTKTEPPIVTSSIVKNNTAKGRHNNWQPRIEYENPQKLIDFLKECDKHSSVTICSKYGLTSKQLSNRKYLIKKFLDDNNIKYECADKRGRG